MNLDKFAADLIEALLKDLGDTFPKKFGEQMLLDAADLYGWRVARAEALADRLKKEMLLAPALKSEEMRKLMAAVRDESLRDNFAGLALASEFEAYGRFTQTSEEAQQKHREHVARQCYLMADAMLVARNPEPQPVTVEAKT